MSLEIQGSNAHRGVWMGGTGITSGAPGSTVQADASGLGLGIGLTAPPEQAAARATQEVIAGSVKRSRLRMDRPMIGRGTRSAKASPAACADLGEPPGAARAAGVAQRARGRAPTRPP